MYVGAMTDVNKSVGYFQHGNERWNKLDAPDSMLYPWDHQSTYIQSPPFFETMVCIYVYIVYCSLSLYFLYTVNLKMRL